MKKLSNIVKATGILSLITLLTFLLGSTITMAQTELHVVRGNGQYPPFEMMEKQKLRGMHVELVNQVAVQLKWTIRWESVPWSRAMTMMKRGDADAITYAGLTPEREQFLHYLPDNELSVAELGFVVLNETASQLQYAGDFQTLAPLGPVVALRGYSYGAEFDNDKELPKYFVKETNQILNLLKGNKYKVGIVNVGETRPIARSKGVIDLFTFLKPYVSRTPSYIAFSKPKNLGPQAKVFAEAMAAFKQTPDYQAILESYGLQE